MSLKLVSKNKSFSGEQRVYSHVSQELDCEMKFAVYLPESALDDESSKGIDFPFSGRFFPITHLVLNFNSSCAVLLERTYLHGDELHHEGWCAAYGSRTWINYCLSGYLA